MEAGSPSGGNDADTPDKLLEELNLYMQKINHFFSGTAALTTDLDFSEGEEEKLLALFKASRLTEAGQCRNLALEFL